MSIIGIIGSGGMAAAIGGLAAKAGHTVEVTSRDAAKARALAEQFGAGATTGTFGAVPAGDIVILAVPYSAVLDVVKQYGEALAGKLLVDITNPVASDYTSFVTPEDSFGAQEIAKAAPPATGISSRRSTPSSPTSWLPVQSRATLWTCSSPGTTRRRRHASRRSSRASDCARWTPVRCSWRGRWSTSACCRWASSSTPSSTPTSQSASTFSAELSRSITSPKD
jgi:hypothetical protein